MSIGALDEFVKQLTAQAHEAVGESGGPARLVLEKPVKHFFVLRGQPNGEGLAEHVITGSRNEYKSIRDADRRHYGGRDGISQDPYDGRSV